MVEELSPDDVVNLVNLATAFAATGQDDLARNRLAIALQLEPENAVALALRAELGD